MRCFKCFQYASTYNYLQKTCSLTISEREAVAPASECFFLWWGWRWRWEQGKGFCKSLESFAFSLGLEQVRRGMKACRISDGSQQKWRQHDLLDQGHRTCVRILALPPESCAWNADGRVCFRSRAFVPCPRQPHAVDGNCSHFCWNGRGFRIFYTIF